MSASRRRGVISLSFETALAASARSVWAAAADLRGVNAELAPWFHMTCPRGGVALRADDPVAVAGFRSWLLFAGVLPVDRHSFGFARFDDGGFLEESTSWMNLRWRHRRSVRSTGPGACVVRDELLVEPRIASLSALSRMGVRAVFAHRHRRLAARYGTAGASTRS